MPAKQTYSTDYIDVLNIGKQKYIRIDGEWLFKHENDYLFLENKENRLEMYKKLNSLCKKK